MENTTDIFIIGGGINGTAIAADAAGRGLSVTLCEKNDLASGTSSASTKLIHGGLRYLEFYEFMLVRKALQEREVLMRRAPHLIAPLEFILPYEKHLRSPWLIRLGLFLYDHLAKRNLVPGSKAINFKIDQHGKALLPEFEKGFSYYDCLTDDARLVILNAKLARELGANIRTRTEFVSAHKENNLWKITLKNLQTGKTEEQYSKALINVAGPWVSDVQIRISDTNIVAKVQLVKGSHIVVPKLYEGNFAFLLECKDKRVIFTIPYQDNFTLIGTTDVAGNTLESPEISTEEINYLCSATNDYFQKKIQPTDIVWSYAGVRCLQADGANLSKITRNYKFLLDLDTAPLLTIIGGKLTTHRLLAEDALKQLKPLFPNMGPAWTANKPLPGYGFNIDFENFYQAFKTKHPWLPESIAYRYAKNYGTLAYQVVDDAKNIFDLGEVFAAGLYQKEIEYLIKHEWAQTAEDILWRRTKLGLYFSREDIKKLNDWLKDHTSF
ncbi:MAG: glycerol-3-phosphate dehydrogenase [Gammaproteobacteria bacterium]